jgi:DNA replication licensing factor MCM5
VPDECDIVDQQTLKLQEAPEAVPTGEMPRSILMAVDRALCDRASPGTRVSVLAIPTLFQAASTGSGGASNSSKSVKSVYLRVVGLDRDSGSGGRASFTPREEEAFRLLARRADIYDILYRSIAPSISGSYTIDIKKALACQLFSGSRKKLPDGMKLRGDINILLLGDPSMAKSQFLKYVTRIAPVGIYTSGKGSSAAGLTASVVKDQKGEFYLEGGALVLGDGGYVNRFRKASNSLFHDILITLTNCP